MSRLVTDAYFQELEALRAAMSDNRRHEVACLLLREIIRARYNAALHTPDVIAENVRVAKDYAEAMYPEAK